MAERQRRYAEEVTVRIGWTPEPGRFHLFKVDIADVTFIHYDEKTGDQFVARWPGAIEFVRRGTSAALAAPSWREAQGQRSVSEPLLDRTLGPV